MSQSGQRILLVEDDAASRFMMGEMLYDLGFEHLEAKDGQDCLDVLGERPEDILVVLLDLHMPRKSGLDALREIRDSDIHPPRELPVIAVTADSDWHDEGKARAVGFDGVIPKPVSLGKLRATLDFYKG